jgi:hypothetical protein
VQEISCWIMRLNRNAAMHDTARRTKASSR